MASISGYAIDLFGLRMQPATLDFRLKNFPGVNGTGVLFDAWRAPLVKGQTITLTTGANVEYLRDQYRNLQGEVVTVIDQFGITWSQVLVVSVTAEYSQRVTGDWELVAQWQLLPQSEAP